MRINSSPQALAAFRAAAADPYFQARPQFSGDCSPSTPANLTARTTRNGVALSWTGSPNATRYEVWRRGKQIAETAASSYLDKTAHRHATYAYTIRATNPVGSSALSTRVVARRP